MAFVRKKKVGDYEYYYLVESRRINGKVNQKTLASLGHWPTVAKAIEGLKWDVEFSQAIISQDLRAGWVYTLDGYLFVPLTKEAYQKRIEKQGKRIALLERYL